MKNDSSAAGAGTDCVETTRWAVTSLESLRGRATKASPFWRTPLSMVPPEQPAAMARIGKIVLKIVFEIEFPNAVVRVFIGRPSAAAAASRGTIPKCDQCTQADIYVVR